MKHLIIGNSAAGIGCAEGIRREDPNAQITILTAEDHGCYSRPLISYFLKGVKTLDAMHLRPDSFYVDNNVTLLRRTTAISVDAPAKIVRTDEGDIPYDALMIATGSRPFIPPVPGLAEAARTFTTLDDAIGLDGVCDSKRVLIIGAGLIGLKCAEALAHRASRVTVVEQAPRILPAVLDDEGSRMVQAVFEENGVGFALSCGVKEIAGSAAVLSTGESLEFDILVCCAGVRPNVSLYESAGGTAERGIPVDASGRTAVEGIFAAGDATSSVDMITGERKIMALAPNAYRQGFAAGRTMAGGDAAFDNAFPMNATGFFGLHMASAGVCEGTLHESRAGGTLRRLYTSGDALCGFLVIGDVASCGIYTSLIRDRTALSSIDFELIKDYPALMAFSREKRQRILGERV